MHLWCQCYLLVVQCELGVREVRPKQGDNHGNTVNKSPGFLVNFHRAQHFSIQIAGCWIYSAASDLLYNQSFSIYLSIFINHVSSRESVTQDAMISVRK